MQTEYLIRWTDNYGASHFMFRDDYYEALAIASNNPDSATVHRVERDQQTPNLHSIAAKTTELRQRATTAELAQSIKRLRGLREGL